jgi:uncharacterized protein YjbI with pentapeptide repeats
MTTPDTPAKKVVSIEILHLDETGYGPEGKHTRRAWRAACLKYFEAGAEAFLKWQESWQALAEQNQLMASFDVRRTFEDGNLGDVRGFQSQSHCIDFAGNDFSWHVKNQNYQFLYPVLFNNATFGGYTEFNNASFKAHAEFDNATFKGKTYFSKASFSRKADFREANFIGEADFSEVSFTRGASFIEARFGRGAFFSKAIFTGDVHFNEALFKHGTYFGEATFTGEVDFNTAIFEGYADFSETTFTGEAYFGETIFTTEAFFEKAIFKRDAYFTDATFTASARFTKVTFTGISDFCAVNFKKSANFLKAKFHNQSHFYRTHFHDEADFENAEFANVGHFEEAIFNAPTSKIPTFRGVDVGTTLLEFSDDTHFAKTDFTEEAIKNIAFLKHLSEQHGQIDQALNFNAMELRAKYLQVVDPLLAKSLPWFKRAFKRYFSGAWWALRLTWLYWKVSDFGRSYLRPLLYFVELFFVTLVLAAGIATTHKPKNCRYQQFGLISELKCDGAPLPKNPNVSEAGKEDEKLYLSGYQAVFEYASYHATGLVDFTGDSKLKEAINQRLFGEAIKPWWARLLGALISIINTALLFLIALGLRNTYRLK